jgi:imidazolonepropionase-like amidohydrolase
MLTSFAGRVLTGVVAFSGLCALAGAQEPPVSRQERWKFYSPSTQVSNDPRRVPVPPVPQGPDGTLVLRGGRIFDGTGAPAREGSLVIVRNKIAKIVPPGATDWPADARVIELGGKTVIPGLIDLHTHITYAEPKDTEEMARSMSDATLRGVEHLRYYIESGITSIRDVASAGEVPFRLKDWVNQNRIAGPRVFAAGQLITSTDGHGDEGGLDDDPITGAIRVALGPDGWREAVRVQFKRGADVIKIASHFTREEVSAAVSEAHALGLKVTCDCETFYIRWAVEAGVDMIEHPLPRTDETIRLMAEKGTQSDPTLIPYIIIFNLAGGYYDTTSRRFTFSKDANFDLVKKMKHAGITLGIGTDLVSDWYQYLPGPYVTEMKQFVKLGYTVPEVLVVATKTNAQMLDMGDKLGTLEPGKLADVTVIDGKPDVDLDDLAKVSLVIRDGYVEVQDGRLYVPRHVPVRMPEENAKAAGTKWGPSN